MSKGDMFSYKFRGEGLDDSEKKWGTKQFKNYQEFYPHIHKLSDLQLLEELIFLEVVQERYKKKIGEISKDKKVEEAGQVPNPYGRPMRENLEQIMDLKQKLKMFESKDRLDAFKDIQEIFEKFKIWRQKNQGSRKVTCPFCSELFFLMIRTDKYEAKKFPFFEDKLLCNRELHQLWKDEIITTEKYSAILGTSTDFPAWLEIHWFEKLPKTD